MLRPIGLILAVLLAAAIAQAAEPSPPPPRPATAAAPAPAPPAEQAAPAPRPAAAAPAGPKQQEPPPPRTITVTGRAIGYIPRDTVIWTITIEKSGKDVGVVKAASDQQVQTITDACKAKGVQPADIDAGLIRLIDTRSTGSAAADPQKPIQATRNVAVRQRDVLRFNELLDVLSRDKSNGIRYVFVCSSRDDVMRDTIIRATQAARDKATAMANVAGAQLGRPLTIDEYAPPKLNIPDATVPVDRDTPAFGVEAEKIITTVYVTFELE
jgi:uncharacterized protein YggE